jgi:hypothetical protein
MVQELRTRHTATVNGSNIPKGLTDVAFASNESRSVNLNSKREAVSFVYQE